LQKSSKSASTTPQRPIWNSFATVGVRDFWENGCSWVIHNWSEYNRILTAAPCAQGGRRVTGVAAAVTADVGYSTHSGRHTERPCGVGGIPASATRDKAMTSRSAVDSGGLLHRASLLCAVEARGATLACMHQQTTQTLASELNGSTGARSWTAAVRAFNRWDERQAHLNPGGVRCEPRLASRRPTAVGFKPAPPLPLGTRVPV